MNRNRDECWFCAGYSKHQTLKPDGRPLCDQCKAQLQDFQSWLSKGCVA